MLNGIVLSVTNKPLMLSVITLNVIMLSVTNKPFMVSVVMLNGIMLSVTNKPFILSVVKLNVILLSVVVPKFRVPRFFGLKKNFVEILKKANSDLNLGRIWFVLDQGPML